MNFDDEFVRCEVCGRDAREGPEQHWWDHAHFPRVGGEVLSFIGRRPDGKHQPRPVWRYEWHK